MKYLNIEQRSQEWWDLKVGKVSGTRYGQLTSTRSNSLLEEVANETLDGFIEQDDFTTEDIQFGVDNEEPAICEYEARICKKFTRGGVILSDFSPIHMASPDAINEKEGIVVEIKCTSHGKTHLKRFLNGIDSNYLPQVINYFAVSDDVKEVHWVSYCPFRQERPIIAIIFTRDTVIDEKKGTTIQHKVNEGRAILPIFEQQVKDLIESFNEVKF